MESKSLRGARTADLKSDFGGVASSGRGVHWVQEVICCLVCALIVGFFVSATAPDALLEGKGPDAAGSFYNRLVQGFSRGHLYLKLDPPAALTRLANPYDSIANAPYRAAINDLSYYNGKLYLYFGVTPALVLFWPYHLLTGDYLSEGGAVAILFAIGFAAGLCLARSICRRYFPEINIWMLTAWMLVVGLVIGLTLSGNIYEIAIVGGFAFAILALAGIWQALHSRPKHQAWWLLLASFAYGLAVGSRPSLLFGAIILLMPVLKIWREPARPGSRWHAIVLFAAAVGPILLVGVGLMLYNDLRFGNPFEFGWRYQINEDYESTVRQFSLHYLWFNFRFYFLEPFGWTWHFPFLQSVRLPPLPLGHYREVTTACGGILASYPLVLLILALPLMWRNSSLATTSRLRWFSAAIFLLFAVNALTICLFNVAGTRYELDFLPELMLLSLVGFLGLQRITSRFRHGRAIVRLGWCLLLGYSLAFNIFSNVETHAEVDYLEGNSYFHHDRFDEAIAQYENAEALWPDCPDAYYGIGNSMVKEGYMDNAIAEYQKVLELAPDYALAYGNLGYCFLQTGGADAAVSQYQKALELDPKSTDFRCGLGNALLSQGHPDQALAQYQKALEIQPHTAEEYGELASCFFQIGRKDDAITQYQKAVELDPTSAARHALLGAALYVNGHLDEAIAQCLKATELQPDFTPAYLCLGDAYFKKGEFDQAVPEYQKVIELQPDSAQAYNGLGDAFRGESKATNAIASYRKAIEIQPQFLEAQVNLAWMLAAWPDASVRNGTDAVALMKNANDLSGNNDARILRALAAADAETGQFAEAATTAKRALELAGSQSDVVLRNKLQADIKLYESRLPLRSTNN